MLTPLTVWITTNWKILKKMGIPDQLTYLLWNLYSGQEATVRIGHRKMDWFQIGKGIGQVCILSPCLFNICRVSSVQLLSHVRLFATPWTAPHQASPSITNSRSLLKLMSIESMVPSNHLNLCHPLLLLPSIFSSIRVFSSESVLRISWLKYWSFSFIISPSNEYSGLLSFRIDWFYLLAVHGTLKSLL